MNTLFFYGTLRFRPLLELVLGGVCTPTLCDAVLPDHQVLWVDGASFPMIRAAKNRRAPGLLVQGLSDEALARLNFYEGGFAYDLADVQVEAVGGAESAQVYFPEPGLWPPGAPWSLSEWQRDWADITLHAAREVMSYYGKLDAGEVARLFPMIRMRAASRVRAETPAPATLRAGYGAPDLDLRAARRPYTNFFALEEHDIAFRRFDGTMSEVVNRAGFVGGDAVTVLPYDPLRDRVLVVEQFRFGPYLRGDPRPWVLEPVAGRIDPGESPQTCAHRETMEEAGLTLSALEHIADYYPSPGGVSEFVTSYIGIADLPDTAAGIGGVAHEAENIRAHVIPYQRLLNLVSTGEAGCGPLVLSALWLAQNRDRLRAAS